MSVFRHKRSSYFHYDFQLQGARFRGSTGKSTKREAEREEARIRASIEIGTSSTKRRPQLTLGEAASRFWLEKGQYESDADSVWYQLENLVDGLGKGSLLSKIGMSELAEYQATRRSQKNRRGKMPANRSLNAECPDLIRRVFNRAATLWNIDIGDERRWADLKLRIPKGRTRELQASEELRLFEALREDYRDVIEFDMITGLRRAALLLRWDQIDLDAGTITYLRKSIHANDVGILPISQRMRALLTAQQGNDPVHVWTYVAKRTRDDRIKGTRYPITEEGIRITMQRAVKKARLPDWRGIHDLRHTAATRRSSARPNAYRPPAPNEPYPARATGVAP